MVRDPIKTGLKSLAINLVAVEILIVSRELIKLENGYISWQNLLNWNLSCENFIRNTFDGDQAGMVFKIYWPMQGWVDPPLRSIIQGKWSFQLFVRSALADYDDWL